MVELQFCDLSFFFFKNVKYNIINVEYILSNILQHRIIVRKQKKDNDGNLKK